MNDTRAQKSKILAIVLALLLGGLGVHNFYMGHNTLGLAKLALNAFGIAMSLLAAAALAGYVLLCRKSSRRGA